MYSPKEKPRNIYSRSIANSATQKKNNGKKIDGLVDNRAKIPAQNKGSYDRFIFKENATNLSPMQLEKYGETELPDSTVNYSQISWHGYNLPKRMIARGLNRKQAKTTESQIDVHSALWGKLKNDNHGIAVYYDGHLLNHKLGGVGKSPNLVPINNDANHQMSHFDGFVIKHISKVNEGNESEVVDLEVSVNYGRNNGETTAENAIPDSLDMRMIRQKKVGNEWVDDGVPLVQNVKVDIAPKIKYKKVEEEKAANESSRNMMAKHFNIQKPPIESIEPSKNKSETPMIPEKNEFKRQQEYSDFTQTDIWRDRKKYENEGDIVSGDIQDERWTRFQKPFNVTAEVMLDDDTTGGIGHMIHVTVKYEGSSLLSLEANEPWDFDDITIENLQTLILSSSLLENAVLTEFEIDD